MAPHRVGVVLGWAGGHARQARHSPSEGAGRGERLCKSSGQRSAEPPSQHAQCCSGTENPSAKGCTHGPRVMGVGWAMRLRAAASFCCGGYLATGDGRGRCAAVYGQCVCPHHVGSTAVERDAEQETQESARVSARRRSHLSTEAVLARIFTATSAALESPALHPTDRRPHRVPAPSLSTPRTQLRRGACVHRWRCDWGRRIGRGRRALRLIRPPSAVPRCPQGPLR